MEQPTKSKRTFTKRVTTVALLWAMSMATYTLVKNPDLYIASLTALLPFMVAIIGAYQGTGHADYRAALKSMGDQDD